MCISEKKGVLKHAVDSVELNDKGIIGDAHSGDCVMPREGIFTKVITGGKIKAGDDIKLI